MSFKNISFILHKPQLSENIGACARALKNFNFQYFKFTAKDYFFIGYELDESKLRARTIYFIEKPRYFGFIVRKTSKGWEIPALFWDEQEVQRIEAQRKQ